MKELERLWREFDRSTAWGCTQRGRPFDRARCVEHWAAYERALCAKYGWSEWRGPRPIGIPA